MKKTTTSLFLLVFVLMIAACSSSKKSTSTASTAPAKTSSPSSSNSLMIIKPNGTHAPGDAELTAIQVQYKDCTLAQLNKGHEIYTAGACIGCHGAMNIYDRTEAQWKPIIDDMARKANITDAEKDAVYKYVLAIKATQPK